MKQITKKVRIATVVIITIIISQNITAQPRVKAETMLKINLTELVSKTDSVYNPQSILKVVCVGADSRGMIEQKIIHTYPGIPFFTGVEFSTLKITVSIVGSEIKPQSFTFNKPKSIETINMVLQTKVSNSL